MVGLGAAVGLVACLAADTIDLKAAIVPRLLEAAEPASLVGSRAARRKSGLGIAREAPPAQGLVGWEGSRQGIYLPDGPVSSSRGSNYLVRMLAI